ncbi:MAG: hypothetical protein LBK60_06795 [Verrucomicrobiales bacterium]|jgi:hypothetical protein|nr:hypothetical protein [Verrucomicrobiales bacterium]
MNGLAIWLSAVLLLAGCGSSFGPGFSCSDKMYFAEQPVVIKKDGQYFLRWRYGEWGFYFQPEYKIKNHALWFSLQGTTSSGDYRGRMVEMPIEGRKEIEALQTGGAFWWERDGAAVMALTILEIK